MTLAHRTATIPAFPLGRPFNGQDRYGMTPEQAELYRWLVKHKPHDAYFAVDFRNVGRFLGRSASNVHWGVEQLVERGWLEWLPAVGFECYRLVHPIMHYPERKR